MSVSMWLRSPRLRRGIALSAVVLATGGLVLHRASAAGSPTVSVPVMRPLTAAGKNAASFAGPGLHGVVALSHTHVLSGQDARIFADVRVVASPKSGEVVRAPLSLAVVLDTSGSMSGEKIADAKRSVLRLLAEMRDDDQIAVVRYSDTSEVVQPLARVGLVRSALAARIRELDAGGGTNIPGGLSHGLRALDEAAKGRVRRIVLVSDGLDGTRAQAEALAARSFSSGITVSSLGIGLDFDESYMGSVAQNGHGNFAFVNDGSSLASFLTRELEETATTTVENARVRLRLPEGARFVGALGADATVNGSEIELALGSLFAGDERRVIVEMDVRAPAAGTVGALEATASWKLVGGDAASASATPLTLVASDDARAVEAGRDGAVLANATSAVASRRQIEAANAYARGDIGTATRLAEENEQSLAAARAAAPAAEAAALDSQLQAYKDMKDGFVRVAPSSAEGKVRAKSAAAKEMSNIARKAW